MSGMGGESYYHLFLMHTYKGRKWLHPRNVMFEGIQIPTWLLIIITLFALENNAHYLKRLQLVSTYYFNS